MTEFHPKGKRLPALERNILKLRAFELVLLLFHVEDLKSFVLESVRATRQQHFPVGTKGLFRKLWAYLVSEGILSEEESDDLQQIIDYRNVVAHQMHQLTGDIGRNPAAMEFREFTSVRYDYSALKRLRQYRAKIESGMRSKFVMSLSFDALLYEAAEETYNKELARLKSSIRRQIREREDQIAALNAEVDNLGRDAIVRLEPRHPANLLRSGRLSSKGVACCHALFERGLSSMAVAHLMRVSYPSITARRIRWEATRREAIGS